MKIQNAIEAKMSGFKSEMKQFLQSFFMNYSKEISRNSLTPLMNEIEDLKIVHNDIRENRLSVDQKYL